MEAFDIKTVVLWLLPVDNHSTFSNILPNAYLLDYFRFNDLYRVGKVASTTGIFCPYFEGEPFARNEIPDLKLSSQVVLIVDKFHFFIFRIPGPKHFILSNLQPSGLHSIQVIPPQNEAVI